MRHAVHDLARRLGLPQGQLTDRNVIIVVDIGGRTVGLLVDAVSDILAIPKDDMAPPPSLAADDGHTFVSALTIVDGRMIRILDLVAVMPDGVEMAA